ncbi:CARDB domain-containing protein [Halalkalicoccus subterraneus]|uniref:CARDB domain-containing protein n=1 Tax=Halalkalicoccus subterraneus TaxID=2675002 RepID=UPI000EFD566C|nr:CARDB domain-containing protein [Halalkalicoccus subterraneus]
MGSVSISHLIIFIASLLIAASVAGTLIASVEQVSNSVDEQSEDLSQQVDTDLTVISDPASTAIYEEEDGNGTVTVLVKNTGRSTLDGSELDVLLDGTYRNERTVDLVSGGQRWSSGAVAAVTIDLDGRLDGGDHRVTVIAHGSRATFDFYHETSGQ